MKNKLIGKTFSVLSHILEAGRPISLKELSEIANIEKSSVWRIAGDLCELGYIRKVGYRHVEPSLGIIFLGQAVSSESFFPKQAVSEILKVSKKLNVNCALAGLFNLELVYLYHSHLGQSLGSHTKVALHRSNIAICLLCRIFGAEKAYEIMSEDIEKAGCGAEEQQQLREKIRENIAFMMEHDYCVMQLKELCNICFPVEYKSTVYGLSFFYQQHPNRSYPKILTECSLLRNELQSLLSGRKSQDDVHD